jgi:uncharacterized protein YjbI with pentapeptide repeats
MAEMTRKELIVALISAGDHPRLSGLDLTGLDLSEIDLNGVNLRNTRLSEADSEWRGLASHQPERGQSAQCQFQRS